MVFRRKPKWHFIYLDPSRTVGIRLTDRPCDRCGVQGNITGILIADASGGDCLCGYCAHRIRQRWRRHGGPSDGNAAGNEDSASRT